MTTRLGAHCNWVVWVNDIYGCPCLLPCAESLLAHVRPGVGGDGVGPDYGNWDGDHVTVCNCDWGFFGPDCSLRICAKDDDPTTSNQK